MQAETSRKQIVVGVLRKGTQVLLSVRQKHQAYADYWEFPGGKVEAGEDFELALEREFHEEVDIETRNWQPLIQIPWDYEHASVMLNVFETEDFVGEPHGKEGQTVAWVETSDLSGYRFPEANEGIVSALTLPDAMMITGDFANQEDALHKLEIALKDGVRLVQLRAKKMEEQAFLAFAKQAIPKVHAHQGKVLINGKPEWLSLLPEADGLQLASTELTHWAQRPVPEEKLLSISTHNELEIAKALELKADIILLSPVKPTSSHPDMEALGWMGFQSLVQNVPVPVYALGGMKASDISEAKRFGAQGVAAISSFWPTTL